MERRQATANSPLALVVLAFLTQRPMHPYEIGRLLRERSVHHSVKYRSSSLYTVVSQLHRAGHIAPRETTRAGRRPERTTYALTPAGRAELHDRMRDLVAVPAKEYRQFEAALALIIVLPPDEVAELLEQRQASLTEQAAELRGHLDADGEEREDGFDRLFLIEYEYRLALIEAEQAFVDRFLTLIRTGGPDFGAFWRENHEDGDQ